MKITRQYPELRLFEQHGITFDDAPVSNGTQALGTCIQCGLKKFYVNVKTRAWDCKHCQISGGVKHFLALAVSFAQSQFKGAVVVKLMKDHPPITAATLRKWGVGYNPYTDRYIIPAYCGDGSVLTDVRIYKLDGRPISTAGCMSGLIGWDRLQHADDGQSIAICEGEWDGMALDPFFNGVVVAVPGAGVFKTGWIQAFQGRDVFVMYDHDEPGAAGMAKVKASLHHVARTVAFMNWPENLSIGYDVRDYCLDHPKEEHEIFRFLGPGPPSHNVRVSDTQGVNAIEQPASYTGDGTPAQQVVEAYRKWLHVPDENVIDMMYGAVFANRLPGDPLWMFFVAPPGWCKTELLLTLSEGPGITTTTSLTPQTLVSGANFAGGGDPSLIPRLDGKVLIIKDFTTILNKMFAEREEIFGILRDAYDGKTEKIFGNGVVRRYKSKFGVLAAVTPVIEMMSETHPAMGERFLSYKFPLNRCPLSNVEYVRRAMANVTHETTMRAELLEVGKAALNRKFEAFPMVPEEIQTKILYAAQWVAMMRGSVLREKYTGDVAFKPFQELGTRLAKQLQKQAMGVAMFRGAGQVSDMHYKQIIKLAKDTVPTKYEELFRLILHDKYARTNGVTAQEAAKLTETPVGLVRRTLEDLHLLRVLHTDGDSMHRRWIVREDMIEVVQRAGLYNV